MVECKVSVLILYHETNTISTEPNSFGYMTQTWYVAAKESGCGWPWPGQAAILDKATLTNAPLVFCGSFELCAAPAPAPSMKHGSGDHAPRARRVAYRWPNVCVVPTLARTRTCRATAKHDTTVLACLPCRA
jgi:hypothetical protein